MCNLTKLNYRQEEVGIDVGGGGKGEIERGVRGRGGYLTKTLSA